MEIQLKNFLRPLIKIIDGLGHGYGHGNGDGNGDGNGHGHDYGYGYDYVYGNRDDGIVSYNNQKVYLIDNTKTIITTVKGDIAKGFIVKKDLTLEKCTIIRNNYHYAHGKNLKDANKSLIEKTNNSLPITERIKMFKNYFKNYDKKYKNSLFYKWHHTLTGSCKMGRELFIKEHGISLNAYMTVNDFIDLTHNNYGGDIIKQLK